MIKEDCIFCKIANGTIPAKTIYEDETAKVILDLAPATRGHALIIPKNHYDNLFDLDDAKAEKIMIIAKKVGEALMRTLGCQGLNLVQNNGEVAGQTVFHFHMHIIPRYEDDGQTIGWKQLEMNDSELEKIQKIIVNENGTYE